MRSLLHTARFNIIELEDGWVPIYRGKEWITIDYEWYRLIANREYSKVKFFTTLCKITKEQYKEILDYDLVEGEDTNYYELYYKDYQSNSEYPYTYFEKDYHKSWLSLLESLGLKEHEENVLIIKYEEEYNEMTKQYLELQHSKKK